MHGGSHALSDHYLLELPWRHLPQPINFAFLRFTKHRIHFAVPIEIYRSYVRDPRMSDDWSANRLSGKIGQIIDRLRMPRDGRKDHRWLPLKPPASYEEKSAHTYKCIQNRFAKCQLGRLTH